MGNLFVMHHTPDQTRVYHEGLQNRANALKIDRNAKVFSPSLYRFALNTNIPQRLTLAARQEGVKLVISYSACSWGDNFCRKTGRKIAVGRLGTKKRVSSARYKVITVEKDLSNKDIHSILKTEATLITHLEREKKSSFLGSK